MNDLPIRESDLRREHLLQHVFPAVMSLVAVAAAILMVVEPAVLDRTAIARLAPGRLELGWLALYVTGAGLSLAGLWRRDGAMDASGWIFQATAYATDALALTSVRGQTSVLVAILVGGLALSGAAHAAVMLARPEVQPWSRRSRPR